ncbi:hypothetical protein RUM43_004707 [Polyplax serrata]|uniref:Uncharacterized protein n=1 Tax=Polyplax serrata TaxID=468196 RepID=A0AAN8SB40_POLSC
MRREVTLKSSSTNTRRQPDTGNLAAWPWATKPRREEPFEPHKPNSGNWFLPKFTDDFHHFWLFSYYRAKGKFTTGTHVQSERDRERTATVKRRDTKKEAKDKHGE